jgi:hypothetical protein
MSPFVAATIACACGERYPVRVANGLHVSQRPELRQQILDGTLHRFACPACGKTTQLDDMLAFTDFPRRQWFLVAPHHHLAQRKRYVDLAEQSFRTTMVDHAPPLVVEWSREMTRRVLFGLAALREKLVIGDAGLDDRVVELLKIQLVRDTGAEFSLDHYFHLVAVRGDDLVFERTHPDGEIRSFTVPRGLYDDLARHPDLARWIADAFPDGLVIDHRAMLAADAAGGVRT